MLLAGATLALVGFSLAPSHVTTASAAPATPDATETALVLSAAAAPDTVIQVRSNRAGASSAAAAHNMMIAAAIRGEGQGWLGTPYRWGGTTRRGIDCSAFVQQLMRATFDIELPRTTATQIHRGERIAKSDLIPGDLVFFRRRGVRHVGVYMGNDEFIHASSSRGVTVSKLSSTYYTRHYWQSRRVLPEFVPPTPEPRRDHNEAQSASEQVTPAPVIRN
jgi:cell wall-associated NlpC family hydrolase